MHILLMLDAAIGYEVVSLHRTSFCGITLSGLSSGNWKELSGKEIKIISNALEKVANRNNPKPDKEDNAE